MVEPTRAKQPRVPGSNTLVVGLLFTVIGLALTGFGSVVQIINPSVGTGPDEQSSAGAVRAVAVIVLVIFGMLGVSMLRAKTAEQVRSRIGSMVALSFAVVFSVATVASGGDQVLGDIAARLCAPVVIAGGVGYAFAIIGEGAVSTHLRRLESESIAALATARRRAAREEWLASLSSARRRRIIKYRRAHGLDPDLNNLARPETTLVIPMWNGGS